MPDYQRVDVRWTQFIPTERGRFSFFVEAFNTFNSTNVRGYFTSLAFNGRNVRLVRGTRSQLPRIPSFGLTWEF